MIRKLSILFFSLFTMVSTMWGQEEMGGQESSGSDDPCIIHEHNTKVWNLEPTTGEIIPTKLDSAFLNFYRKDVEDAFTTSYNYLGNFGSPGESRTYFERLSRPEYIFMNAYQRFNVTPSKMRYYNTQIPYTQLEYLSGGSKQNAEERFLVNFGGNINKRFGLGTSLDYVYTRGYYNFQGVNTLGWQAYAYYLGERYQMKLYTNLSRFGNQENGGIQDRDYILSPESTNANLSDPKNIPTNLTNAWNRIKHRDVYFTQKYSLGFDKTTTVNDTIEYTEFVPVTSFFHTFHLNYSTRRFRIDEGGIQTEGYFANTYYNDKMTNDTTQYLSVKNTLGITLNEGFHKYAKFGLAAYASFEYRKYTNMVDSTQLGFIDRKFTTPLLRVGGQLSKRKGSILTYYANAEFTLSGYSVGDIDVNGVIQTKIPLFKDSVFVRAKGFYKLQKPSYYYNHYYSNHFRWSNDFDREQRMRITGELEIPISNTKLSAGVENLTKYIYFNNAALPTQHNGNLQVFQAKLEQDFKVGILNWNNDIVYQKSSNQEVMPLPELSIYSQLFIDFRIAKVLQTQIGFDCFYFTHYFAPTYQPATQMYHTQSLAKVGNYPLVNVYANMKLKSVRFFAMLYHANKGLFGGNDYFASPFYPLNPRMFKFGVSVEFGN